MEEKKKIPVPVCQSCLYPPDSKRIVMFFENIVDALRYFGQEDMIIEENYYDEERIVAVTCPKYKCQRFLRADSIEDLLKVLNWNPVEPKDEREAQIRTALGKLEEIKLKSIILEIINHISPEGDSF